MVFLVFLFLTLQFIGALAIPAQAMVHVLKMPNVRERLVDMAFDGARPGPIEIRTQVEGDAARWVKLAQEMNIQPLD